MFHTFWLPLVHFERFFKFILDESSLAKLVCSFFNAKKKSKNTMKLQCSSKQGCLHVSVQIKVYFNTSVSSVTYMPICRSSQRTARD